MSDRHYRLQFDENIGQRLDKYLVKKIPDLSRTRIQALIKDGQVSVNQKKITKTGEILTFDDLVELVIPPAVSTDLEPQHIPLDIIYEDKQVIIVNKPAGMVTHPSAGHESGTLVHAILGHAPEIEGVGGVKRPGIVHRLDKNTSGLIIIAKNDHSHRWLQDQFRLRSVDKTYLALLDGRPPTPKGRIEMPIGRDPIERKKMAVLHAGKGREAITEFYSIESFEKHTYVRVKLMTGRTHQVRLHMAYLKSPLVGDTLYGYKHPTIKLNRHFLHAYQLGIILPGENIRKTFQAELPEELMNILSQLRAC